MNDPMSPREFDNYVGLLGRLLRLRTSQREAIADELRAHLEERFAALTEQGVGPQEAISMALAEFGDAAALAAQFSSVARLQRRRWMMRLGVTSAVSVVLAVAVVISVWPDGAGHLSGATAQAKQPGEKPTTPDVLPNPFSGSKDNAFSESSANAATVAKLEKIGSVNFVDAELGEVLAYFAKSCELQIYLDRKALEEQDMGSDTLVSIMLRDVPIEMLLRKVLEPLDLTYMLDHGVVIVTTRDEEESHREIRVYRVDDLVRAADKTALPGPALGPTGQRASRGGVANIRLVQMMGPAISPQPPHSDNPDMAALMHLIVNVVEPESWAFAGGTGAIVEYRGVLVVSQTTRTQMKIEKLLKELREAMPAEGKEPASRQTSVQVTT